MSERLHGKRKLKRDQAIRDFEFQHPQYTQKEIADAFGLSQGHTSVILSGLCPHCGAHLVNWQEVFGEPHDCQVNKGKEVE